MKRKIEVLIRIDPQAWLNKDQTDNLSFFMGRVTQRVEDEISQKVIERCLDNIHLPEIEISPEEVKDRMLTIMAKRALEKEED